MCPHLLIRNRYRRYRHLLAQLMKPEPSSLLASNETLTAAAEVGAAALNVNLVACGMGNLELGPGVDLN